MNPVQIIVAIVVAAILYLILGQILAVLPVLAPFSTIIYLLFWLAVLLWILDHFGWMRWPR